MQKDNQNEFKLVSPKGRATGPEWSRIILRSFGLLDSAMGLRNGGRHPQRVSTMCIDEVIDYEIMGGSVGEDS